MNSEHHTSDSPTSTSDQLLDDIERWIPKKNPRCREAAPLAAELGATDVHGPEIELDVLTNVSVRSIGPRDVIGYVDDDLSELTIAR